MNMAIITTPFDFPPLGFEYDRNNKHSRSIWANKATLEFLLFSEGVKKQHRIYLDKQSCTWSHHDRAHFICFFITMVLPASQPAKGYPRMMIMMIYRLHSH